MSTPPDSVSRINHQGRPAINLNLFLSKESTPTKDVGTTVDKTLSQLIAYQSTNTIAEHSKYVDVDNRVITNL